MNSPLVMSSRPAGERVGRSVVAGAERGSAGTMRAVAVLPGL